MNPYEPPDDESQLDRIERKIDRLNGWYLLTLIIGGELAALGFCWSKSFRLDGSFKFQFFGGGR
jgi:hypothetical protein